MPGDNGPGLYDASDPVAENNARREQERKARNDLDVVRLLLSTPARRDWLYRKLEACHIYGNAFMGEETHKTSFALGEENIGKQLMLEAMAANPENYMLMMKEAKAEEDRKALVLQEQNKARDGTAPPPRAEDQVPELNPPEGWPGHVPPKSFVPPETK